MIHPTYDSNLFPDWTSIPVRFRDLDPLNHVNNALFSTFYEEARIHFINRVPEFADQLEHGFSFVLATIQIDFIKPVEYPAELLVGSGIRRLGNSSITSFQAIYLQQSKELVSVAEASGVWFDVQKKKPSRIPELKNEKELLLNSELFE